MNKHGGKRPGAGRPAQFTPEEKPIPLSVRVPQWLRDKVDEQPASRSDVVRRALQYVLGGRDDENV